MVHRAFGMSSVRILAVLLLAALIPACGGSSGDTTAVSIPSTVSITSIAAAQAAIAPGGTVVLTATAADSAGGFLTYAWTAPSGSLGVSSGNTVTWTAPLSVGAVLIQVTVTSTSGSSAGGVASVVVSTNPIGGSVTITSVGATPTAVLPGAGTTLFRDPEDPCHPA